MPKLGRPSKYTPEIAKEICNRLAEGETLIDICKDDHMPGYSTVNDWHFENREGFSAMYARARESQAYKWVEDCLHIADETEYDLAQDEDGKTIVNFEHIQRSRLKIDTRKWIATKIAARVFGDRVTQELIGDENRPLVTEVVDRPPRLSREEWLKEYHQQKD